MIQIIARACLLCGAIASLTPAFAQTSWAPSATLSIGGQGWESAAAMDPSGNSLAIWDERTSMDHLWSRSKVSLSDWGPVTQVSPASPGLQATSVFPALRVSASGFATAVWTDSDGVWTVDRAPSGKWNPSQLLIPGASSPLFVMNSEGAAAIAWTVGGPPSTAASMVWAVSRPAGGSWGTPQLIATGLYVGAEHVGISQDGAAIVTWESFKATCREYCVFFDFVLHASRQDTATAAWVDSGALLGPTNASHDARVALDASGRAMLLALSGNGTYMSATQSGSGSPWSAFAGVRTSGTPLITDLLSDNAGNVTLVYEAINGANSQVFVANAAIGNNMWSPPAVLSGSDMRINLIYFALAPNGAAVVAWTSNTATPEIHAATRLQGTWSSPLTVAQPDATEIGTEAAAVNSAGQAVVTYSGYNTDDVHTEYAANYTP